jgi:lipoate-protein ligase A
LHERWPEESSRNSRVISVCDPTAPPTLVLGSSQRAPELDPEFECRTGVVLARRSTGGGAVSIEPGGQVWIDVWIPRDDPLWVNDVVLSGFWLGRAWLGALEENGVADLVVHTGRLNRTPLSDLVCFAGIGPGEVSVGKAKLVGTSQRRNREGALIHTYCPLDPVGRSVLAPLAISVTLRLELEELLAREATCLRDAVGVADDLRPDGVTKLLSQVADSVVSFIEGSG